MNNNRKILALGAIFLLSGIITAWLSYDPSRILQYLFIAASLGGGALAFRIGWKKKESFVQSRYYTWIGTILILGAISLGIWATTLLAFVNVVGLFLLVLGIGEFVFVQQIFSKESPFPWKILALKITLSAITATGAAWILTMSRIDVNVALFFVGVLTSLVGLNFMHVGRLTKLMDPSRNNISQDH